MQRKITDLFATEEKRTSSIHESKKIGDFLSHCQFDTFVVLDLDNTVFETTDEFGSDQWFRSIINYYKSLSAHMSDEEKDEVMRWVVTIYNEVQHHVNVKLVEPEIMNIIKALQDSDIPVLALTARGAETLRPTLKHLNQIGVNFYRQWGNHTQVFNEKNDTLATFSQGIIFCEGHDKGKCLDSFFESLGHYPRHVLMVDDKEHNLDNVQKFIKKYGGHFTGLRYGYLDEKASKFDLEKKLEKSDDAINKISHLFSDNGKEALKKLNALKLGISSQGMFAPKTIVPESIPEKTGRELRSII